MAPSKSTVDALARIATETNDLRLLYDVRRMQRRLAAISMAEVLDKVPGNSVTDKVRALGITRTTYYSWLHGITRPRARGSLALLSRITGYGVDEIRGE